MTSDRLPDWLLLVPTALERDALLEFAQLEQTLAELGGNVQLCGFGPVAAAAQTARILARSPYRRVFLAGIAGSYTDSLPIGSACMFQQVSCWGVGAGSGDAFQIAPEIGFSQLSAMRPERTQRDIIDLATTAAPHTRQLLLTCCAASQSNDDCLQRLRYFPEAVAEDMEGFGVALACREARVPLAIVRGISNRAGDRCVSDWAIRPALKAAAELLTDVLKSDSRGTR